MRERAKKVVYELMRKKHLRYRDVSTRDVSLFKVNDLFILVLLSFLRTLWELCNEW